MDELLLWHCGELGDAHLPGLGLVSVVLLHLLVVVSEDLVSVFILFWTGGLDVVLDLEVLVGSLDGRLAIFAAKAMAH